MDLGDSLRLVLIMGANIFGVYALYKIIKMGYWILRDRSSEEEF